MHDVISYCLKQKYEQIKRQLKIVSTL